MRIFKAFTIESAHFLPNVPADHKCRRLHGHTFQIEIHVEAAVGEESGWVMDYATIAATVRPVIDEIDHNLLNAIDGLSNPTSENLAIWIWRRLKPDLPQLCRVVIQENCTSGAIYEG